MAFVGLLELFCYKVLEKIKFVLFLEGYAENVFFISSEEVWQTYFDILDNQET